MTIIHASSGHTMFLKRAMVNEFAGLPHYNSEQFTGLKTVHNWDKDGPQFFFLAREIKTGEWYVWYRKTRALWTSFGKTQQKAIDGAIRDGWLYA